MDKMNTLVDPAPIKSNSFFYYGLLTYTIIFYSQIAGRFHSLEPFRVEFVLGSILLVCIFAKFINGTLPFDENTINKAALFFILAALLTIPFAFVKARALDKFIQLLKFFSIYLMIIAGITDERRLRIFTIVYLACISLLFVEPFILSLQGKGFQYNNHMMRLFGVTGFFSHPNQLGAITAANLPLFYFMMRNESSLFKKGIFASLLIIALRVIMLTQSRTAYVGVLAFIVYLWFLSTKKIQATILILVCCSFIWFAAPQESKDRFMSLTKVLDVVTTGEDQRTSMTSRWILIQRSWTVFLENPIVGVGIGCFASLNGTRWGLWFPTHNLYTEALSEMGIIGTLAFLILIIYIYKNLNRSLLYLTDNRMENSFLYHLTMGLKVYLTIRLVVGFFGHDLYRNWWFLAAGLSVVIVRLIKNNPDISLAAQSPQHTISESGT